MELKFIKKKISEDIDFKVPNTLLCETPTMDRINLNEFILNTVPAEKVAKYLVSCFNFATYNDFDNEKNYGIVYITSKNEYIQLFIRKPDEEEIKKIMGKMGWFCSVRDISVNPSISRYLDTSKKIINSDLFGLQFEKKFNNDETEEVLANNYLYHYTLKLLLGKIQKIGLIPKISAWNLFGGKSKEYTNDLYKNTNDDVNYGKIYLFKHKKGDGSFTGAYFKDKNNFVRDKEFICLKIDVKKLPEGIKFYEDPKQYGAVFTYDNIPPDAIEVDEE